MSRKIRLLVIDVDGTMTDGGIYYDDNGNELKKFMVRDAAGFFTARYVGIEIMVLTGRECNATKKRMTEMHVDYLYQNVKEKASFLREFIEKNGYDKSEIGYIGDDLNDLASMRLCGFVASPLDACREVKEVADYISPYKGGRGVIRDVVEYLLRRSGEWEDAIRGVYNLGGYF